MSKKTIKYTGLVFTFIMAFLLHTSLSYALVTNYTNYYNVEMTQDEYNTLVALGFSEEEIYYMPKEVFEDNQGLTATLLDSTTKYYKTIYPAYGNSYTVEVTEYEYYHHDNNILGQVVSIYETVNTTISANGSKYRYKVTMSWNSIPPVASYDVIGIGFDGDVHISGYPVFYHMYTDSANNTTTSYNYYDKLTSSTGGTATYQVPSNMVGGSVVYYFNVDKDSGAGTITSLEMCGDYGHASTPVTGNQAASHSIDIAGIYFSNNVYNYFDDIPCAPSYASVYW